MAVRMIASTSNATTRLFRLFSDCPSMGWALQLPYELKSPNECLCVFTTVVRISNVLVSNHLLRNAVIVSSVTISNIAVAFSLKISRLSKDPSIDTDASMLRVGEFDDVVVGVRDVLGSVLGSVDGVGWLDVVKIERLVSIAS